MSIIKRVMELRKYKVMICIQNVQCNQILVLNYTLRVNRPLNKTNKPILTHDIITRSAGTVEYTDCTSAEG